MKNNLIIAICLLIIGQSILAQNKSKESSKLIINTNNKLKMENKIYNEDGLKSISLYNIAFTVKNIDESIKWYKEILGFELKNKSTFSLPLGSAEIAILQSGDLKLEILQVPNNKKIEEMFAAAPMHLIPIGNKSIVLQVTNIKLATEQLEQKGVKFVWKEQFIAGDKMLCTMIEDIDGNKINIFQTNTIFEDKKVESVLSPEQIAAKHLKLWSETDKQSRKKIIDELYDDVITVIDPAFKVTGKEKLMDFISDLQDKHSGYVFSLNGKISSHSGMIKFNWYYGPKSDPKKITGTDVLTLNNGMVKTISIFID
ncbi:MAG: VOC family protein [Flavobacterium sp.]|nr:VOC family protein [Flavobacterium sp.]